MTKANRCGKCAVCTCSTSSSSSVYLADYSEVDPSPMATQTLRFFAELEAKKAATGRNFWDSFCELNSSAPECKIYED